jgi:hypothetical protein
MKKKSLRLSRLIIILVLMIFQNQSKACHLASLTLVNPPVYIGGGIYEFTVEICTGSGSTTMGLVCSTAAVGDTKDYSISSTGASILNTDYTPAITSAFNGVVSTGSVSGGILTYTASSSVYQVPGGSDTCGTYGPAQQWCWNVTFRTTGLPTNIMVSGLEGVDVGQGTGSNPCGLSIAVSGTLNQEQPICIVTADSLSAHSIIIWEKPIVTTIDSFRIYREVALNTYSNIASVSYDSLSEYRDYGANPGLTSFKYKLAIVDTSGNVNTLSDYHKTIHLQYLGNGNLQWTLYEIENSGNPVSTYQVLRDDNGIGIFLPVSSIISGSSSTFSDPDYASYPNARYRLAISLNTTCTSTRSGISTIYSNITNQTITSVSLNENSSNIMLFPNPAKDKITIELTSPFQKVELKAFNVIGKETYDQEIKSSKTEINIGSWKKGVYFLEVIIDNSTITFKKLVIN